MPCMCCAPGLEGFPALNGNFVLADGDAAALVPWSVCKQEALNQCLLRCDLKYPLVPQQAKTQVVPWVESRLTACAHC